MATVATLALAAPAVAQVRQDPAEAPIDTEMKTILLAENAQAPLPKGTGGGAPTTPADQAQGAPAAPSPPMTAEQPAEQPADQQAAEKQATPPPDMKFLAVQDEAQFLADDEVIGKDVVNVMDEKVGTIADLVMDQEQKLVGVVLSVGGFLGLGEKWVAVPVEQIQFPADDQPARLRVAVTEEQLTNAPDFKTRATVEAEEAAANAQQQQMQQQIPSPATTTQ
jgi:hypothetical protein